MVGALVILLLVGCGEEERGIEIRYPEDSGISWQYDIYSFALGDTTRVGEMTVRNEAIIDDFNRSGIVEQRKYRRIDSLRSTRDSLTLHTSYLDLSSSLGISLFAEDFFDLFEDTFTRRVIDTLASDDPQGPDFQEFIDYEPLWSPIARFSESSVTSFQVHRPQTFYFDFELRGQQVSGSAEVVTEGLFWERDRINTPIRDSVETVVTRTATHLDFSLQRDSVRVPEFRVTLEYFVWYHPVVGVVRRERRPFQMTVPGIPSRFPSVLDPGERWELTGLEGISFDS